MSLASNGAKSPRTRAFWLCALLWLPACGPVAIGVGIGSAGGGGGGDAPPGDVGVLQPTPPVPTDLQPECDATMVAFNLAQAQGRRARVRFEYDAGQGRRRVPAANLIRYAANGAPDPAQPMVDAGGDFELPASGATGVGYRFLWRHVADLGVVEQRGVSLYLVFGLAERLAPGFASDAAGVTTVQLFANRTVGREISELTELVLSRESPEPESRFVLQAVLRDRGGDRELTSFAFAFAVVDPPTAQDFVALAPEAVTSTFTDSVEVDGRLRSNLTFTFSPLETPVPTGRFPFTLQVQHRETYGPGRNGVPPMDKVGPLQSVVLADAQVGFAPVIESASVVDPSLAASAGGDPGKPWLRLPIAFKAFNPSTTRTMTVRTSGTYLLDNQVRPITPFENGDALSAVEFTLQPLERRRHYLVWNVVRDEGLGNTLANDAPYSPLRTATLAVRLDVVAVDGSPPAGQRLFGVWDSGLFSALSTNPFVDFRDNVVPLARRVWSSGNEITQATRDLFFTQAGASTQETRLVLDQQFEPIQIVPAPPRFDFNDPPYSYTNGVFDLVATDFDAGVPDCLVWIDSQFFHVTWPGPAAAVPYQIGGVGATLTNRGRDPVSFKLTNASGTYDVAVFFTWQEQPVPPNKDVQVQLTAVVRAPNLPPSLAWSVLTLPVEQFQLEGSPAIDISAVGGELNGNAADFELVLGTLGTEDGTAARRGLLAMWSFGLGAAGVTVSPRVDLEPVPLPPVDPARPIPVWLLARWTDATPGDGIVLVRQLDAVPSPSPATFRQCDALLLRRGAASGTIAGQAWTPLTSELTSTAFPNTQSAQLRRIFAEDLDGSVGGIAGSDLLLVFERTSSPQPQPTRADVWLFAQRGGGAAQWRRLFFALEVADPVTLDPAIGRMDGTRFQLVDVNGDRLRDLVTNEGIGFTSEDRHCNYLASSLSGVAGRLGSLGNTAGSPTFRSRLPGLIDANEDGLVDVITGSRLHIAGLDGGFMPQSGNFSGAQQSRHQVERMFLDQPPTTLEVLVADATNPTQNKIDRIGGLGGAATQVTAQNVMSYSLGGTDQVQQVRALMAPDSATRLVKDLVGLDGSATSGTLRRARIDVQTSTVTASSMWSGTAAVDAGLALVRRLPLTSGDPAHNRTTQDVVVVDAGDRNKLVVLRSDAGYAPAVVALPAGQQALRIAEGALSDDALEDVCVMTEDALAYRLVCIQQNATTGIAQPTSAEVLELARFAKPFGSDSAIRTFQLDRGTNGLASGLLLIDDTSSTSDRSEARLIRPIVDATPQGPRLAARIVRSPLSQPVDAPIEVVVTDADQDGLIEVIGGESPANGGLKRLRTNVAPPGN